MERIMDGMLAANPHNRPYSPCIGKREGLLFTDIRLHIASLRRERNPHVFRPDVMFDSCAYSAEVLPLLAQSKGLIQARYVSEEPLPDRRHLQFMPHLADAISRIGGGLAVLDVASETLLTADLFCQKLAESPNQEAEHGVRLAWVLVPTGGELRTCGLRKIGLPELRSDPIPDDERTALESVWDEVVSSMWNGDIRSTYEVERFGQRFRLDVGEQVRGESKVTSARVLGQ
ncbi:MAG: hypothetical protein JNK63_04265 [Chthonomonas sp.]|nr:hypothetical protein [Chthonomonas sp.]